MDVNITKWQQEKLPGVVEEILRTYEDDKGTNHIDGMDLPHRNVIYEILDLLFKVIYPGYIGDEMVHRSNRRYYIGGLLSQASEKLSNQIAKAYRYKCRMEQCSSCNCDNLGATAAGRLLERLPALREMLKEDIHAAYEGDPAARSFEEICTSYPFVTSITTHRIAHELYTAGVPLIPRMMSERAHGLTGVDIHPGAQIGSHFFIDHGTGVVIGETVEIANNVRLYQGVTLGALSFKKDDSGNLVKGGKRHPTIEANVTIYAGASILGGETVIGEGATIGGNVWITKSVPPGALVTIGDENVSVRMREKKKP